MKTVAVFGGNADIVAILVRLINQYDAAEAVSFPTVEELLVGSFDLLLLSTT